MSDEPVAGGPSTSTLRLMVVDDSIGVQRAVREAFADMSHVEVAACGDVEAAEALLAVETPHVVLCDVVLPGRPGYDLCRTLKARPESCRPRVLLLRGAFEPFDEERAQASGADAVLSKPFTAAEVRQMVQESLRPPPEAQDVEAQAFPQAPGAAADATPVRPEDVLRGEAPAAESPTDELARRLVEPLAERLVGMVVDELERRLCGSGPLAQEARRALAQAAEELVRRRIRELEEGTASGPGSAGPD